MRLWLQTREGWLWVRLGNLLSSRKVVMRDGARAVEGGDE